MWIVTTDEFDSTTQVFDTEKAAQSVYDEFVTEREAAGEKYRVFIAKVVTMSDSPEPWRLDED